jgi:SH3-like domain-containing protein
MSFTAFRIAALSGALLLFAAAPSLAAPEQSGLPLPRFVSLRADKANLRAGPGDQYPIQWIYQRPGMPLEVVAEYFNWRRVRDWQGTEGWMHASVLTGRRYAMVIGDGRTVRSKPDAAAPAMATVEPQVIARIRQCRAASPWCEVEIKGIRGWLQRSSLWGVYPDEVID